MQNYKEINGNDYVKDSRTTINETMRSIQSMNSGTAFPTTNLFEGMKCYRTDLKKTYTLTDVENNTWVEDDTASKLSTARKINIVGNATGSANFDGSGDISINTTVNESKHAVSADTATRATAADRATQVVATAPAGGGIDVIHAIMGDNDAARVRVYGDTNNGALEIATSDDGTEPIYVRQYNGSQIDTFATAARTAAILDSNGNTSFPGTVTAASFTGPLNGNATTADRANLLQTTDGNGAIGDGKFHWIGKDGQPMWLWGSNTKPSETYIYNPSNFHVAAANNDGNGANIANTYLKRSGGTMTGAFNFANRTWNVVGDNSAIGDADISGTFCIKGINGDTGIALVAKNGNVNDDYARISYGGGGGTINFSHTIGGNITGSADTVDGYHASDIINRITAANTGGIVAASLTENGYVKFANGLILQWGNYTVGHGQNATFTYPVAVSKVLFASCSPATGGTGTSDTVILSASNTSCTFHNSTGSTGTNFVLVVGLT